jgi:hypothetical protein
MRMNTKKIVLGLIMMLMIVLAASCSWGGGGGKTDNNGGTGGQTGSNPAPVEPSNPVKQMDNGHVMVKEGNRWLITSYITKADGVSVDAFWFTLDEKTEVRDSKGQAIRMDDIPAGAQVEAWHTGPVRESYPAQATAAKILLKTDQDGPRAAAIQAAMKAQTSIAAAWAVKEAALDQENGRWNVDLVSSESPGRVISVRVDAESGEVLPIPVAENKAFRIYAPEQGTVQDSPITVRGEARVFEASFSWHLEDGHTILAEGHQMADRGAPDWGKFEFQINYEKASQQNMMLIIFVHSPRDGAMEQELIIPLKVPENRVQRLGQ